MNSNERRKRIDELLVLIKEASQRYIAPLDAELGKLLQGCRHERDHHDPNRCWICGQKVFGTNG